MLKQYKVSKFEFFSTSKADGVTTLLTQFIDTENNKHLMYANSSSDNPNESIYLLIVALSGVNECLSVGGQVSIDEDDQSPGTLTGVGLIYGLN